MNKSLAGLENQSINGDDMIGLHIIVHSINIPTIIIYQSLTCHHHKSSYNRATHAAKLKASISVLTIWVTLLMLLLFLIQS